MLTLKNAKNADTFICEKCDFKCSKKSDWNRHIITRKHQIIDNCLHKSAIKTPNVKCVCGKEYKHRQSLSIHRKNCIKYTNNENTYQYNSCEENKVDLLINEHTDFKNIIIELVKSNTDLQKQMLDVCKNSNTTINHNNNNSNNKTFNMQVFLNEKCKDAMNLTDFVNSMTLDFSDLEELGKLGYVEGISRQMVRKLNEMDIYKRPIHCSDLKRETIYVRDDDVWEKETELYDKLRKSIKYITKKNGDLMIPWRDAHPQCMNLQHPLNDTYLDIMNQAMGGKGEFAESETKIIRKISKCVTIDKNDM
jgi:hypothetical protein